jgi:hypothetical protein
MASAFNNSALCRHFSALNVGFVFLLFGGPLASADYVYVSNTGAGIITRIDPSGSASIFASGLNSPEGLAFDSIGNLYVANSGDGTISKINSAGNVSIFASGLNSPAALTFDPSGNMYVANPGNQTISKINSSGNASVFVTGMHFGDGPYLAADNAGNIYANTFTAVERFDSNGNRSTLFDVGAESVYGMAFDGAGHLYVATQNACVIFGNGGLKTDVSDYPAPYNEDFTAAEGEDTPSDLAFDANGNLYASFAGMVYDGGDRLVGDINVLIQFGVNGENRVVATDMGGTYIAVQSVPEPGIWTITSGLAAALCLRRRRRRRVAGGTRTAWRTWTAGRAWTE